jgi:hypothetical protein
MGEMPIKKAVAVAMPRIKNQAAGLAASSEVGDGTV